MATYMKKVVAKKDLSRQCYADDGETLIAASPRAQWKVKLRKHDHFFIGLQSGKPSLYGWVHECPRGIPLADIVNEAMASPSSEQIGRDAEEVERQVILTLSSLSRVKAGAPVVTDFTERNFQDKTLIQKVHWVLLRGRATGK